MSKFFDYGDEPNEVSTTVSNEPLWWHIWGTDMKMNIPHGLKLSFWLWGNSEEEIRKMCAKKDVVDITKIVQETPSFAE